MSIDMLKGISFFVLLLLLQVLVFNHIHLFGFATPLLYVYVMLLFRRNFPKWAILCCGFLGGLCVDTDTNGGRHRFENQVHITTVGMFGRVAYCPKLHLGTARRNPDDHAK